MSQLKVNSIVPTGGVASSGGDQLGGGVIQVVGAYKGDRFTTSSASFVDIPYLQLTITTSSTSSKIFVMGSFGSASVRASNLDFGHIIRILRNGSDLNKLNGTAEGSRIRACLKGLGNSFNNDHIPGGMAFMGVDDPASTSALIYKAQVHIQQSAYPFYLNGTPNNGNDGSIYNGRFMCSLIAMEVTA